MSKPFIPLLFQASLSMYSLMIQRRQETVLKFENEKLVSQFFNVFSILALKKCELINVFRYLYFKFYFITVTG
jgi:hypothetical protein